jgi:serine/threonine protein kinase
MPLAPGQVVDRYTVESLIGRGGMANVYKLRHNELGSAYALKVLSTTRADLTERLLVEGRIQASLVHPNVVRVHDVLRVDGAPALVMEWIDGPSLDAWAAGRPSFEAIEAMFRGIVAGVGYAHEHGLVHRDLKPANVLLQRVPDGFVPKITDFGIAKVMQDSSERGLTAGGLALGTPRYMAPEQMRDTRGVDRRADVWALGCVLFELVCGRPAFDGDLISIHADASAGRRPAVRDLAPEATDRVVRAIDACLVPRDARLPDCAALLAVLGGGDVPVVGATTMELPAVAQRIGAYEVLGTVTERDGIGTCVASGPAGEVALKLVPLSADPKRVELFRREIAVVQQLSHPRIAAFVDTFETDDRKLVLARAIVPGVTLAEDLASHRYDRDEALATVASALELLVHLHGLAPPVIVRDVVPERFVVVDGAVHLVDLGLVRDTPADPVLGGSTFHGTFGYMAPEQFRGDASPATDVYGAGALLLRVLTRREPSTLLKAEKLDYAAAVGDPPVIAWLDRVLAADPLARPSSADALAALRRIGPREVAEPSVAPEPVRAAPIVPEVVESPQAGPRYADAPPPVEPQQFHSPPAVVPPGRVGPPPPSANPVRALVLAMIAFPLVLCLSSAIVFGDALTPSVFGTDTPQVTEPAPTPLPPATPAAPSMASPQLLLDHVMTLHVDRGLQGCFAAYRADNPAQDVYLPLDAKFTAAPGKPVTVGFAPGPYDGTALPGCVQAVVADAAVVLPVTQTVTLTDGLPVGEWRSPSTHPVTLTDADRDLANTVGDTYTDPAMRSCFRSYGLSHPADAATPARLTVTVPVDGPATFDLVPDALDGTSLDACLATAMGTIPKPEVPFPVTTEHEGKLADILGHDAVKTKLSRHAPEGGN